MRFPSRGCTVFRVLCISSLLCCSETAFCESAAVSPDYDQTAARAIALFHQKDYAGATALLQLGLAQAAHGNAPEWEATMLGTLGSIYEKTGQYVQAADALQRSVSGLTKLRGPGTPTLIGPLGSLGELYAKAGQYSRAEKLLSRALSMTRAYVQQPEVEARLLVTLGNVYSREHKDTLAEQAADEALQDFTAMEDRPPDISAVYSLLGSLCLNSGRSAEAESWLQQSLSFRESTLGPDDQLIGNSAANLAIFYAWSDQPAKALPLFQRAAAIFEAAGGDTDFVLIFYRRYADFERKYGHKKEARELSKRIDQLWTRSAANTLSRQIVDVSALESLR